MTQLDDKINEHLEGFVVRKDLVKKIKGNAIVPSYVLEYLLRQYCATSDEASIESGIETVKDILAKHYAHRNESELIRSTIREKGRHKVIDKVSVALNEKSDVYEASFANLGITKVVVSPQTVKEHPKLLVSGVWCLADIQYLHTEEKHVPWILDSLKPIQLSKFDFDHYVAARERFTTDEWIDTLLQSIGFNPAAFTRRNKLLQIVRLIPFCERNYNLIELGPKGTGKSHVYSEFSPHGMLISGGEVTVAKLFVNNATGKIGLVGYWDCVAFDEFAGKKKRADKALVDIMKNYMANKSFSRGVETLGAEASMAFVGNTQHSVPHMLRHSDLFDELPEKYHDSAFLDRMHFFLPGWEVDIIRSEMFTSGFGFVIDYLAEVLKKQRNLDYSHKYAPRFGLSEEISTRDRDGIHKTFSGLMKLIHPHQRPTDDEVAELLQLAIEGRKRVKDQLMRFDKTFEPVHFVFTRPDGTEVVVETQEERDYPDVYYSEADESSQDEADADDADDEIYTDQPLLNEEPETGDEPVIETFHGYDLIKRFNAGGMAEAFKARSQETSDIVFLKRVRRQSTDKEALERETRIYEKLSRISTDRILRILDFVRDDEFIGIVTEFAAGGDLHDYLQQKNDGKGLAVTEAREIGLRLAAGINELHSNDIVHRDLKPRNILASQSKWKIADFGISKNLSRLITQKTFQSYGTAGYAAPEQFDGVEAKPSADIYSLGKILVFLLTGQTDVDYVMYPAWRSLIVRCIDLDQSKRPSISEVMSELKSIPV
jgi:ATP-dependent Lon protease